MKLIKIVPSSKAGKKYDAFFETDEGRTKTVSFGAKGMSDFTIHKDPTRRQNYLRRHAPREDWNNPTTPGALSRWLLWNEPTFAASLAEYRRRFKL